MTKTLDYEKDPRSDLEADHVLWVALLTVAREKDLEFFGVLHALRCGGASLERDKDYGLLIRSGEWDEKEYAEFRGKHLISRKAQVVEALRAAAKRLPDVDRDTLKARMSNKVKFAEPRAMALGWTKQELWADQPWDDPRSGERRESLLASLVSTSQMWGHAELGEVTSQYAEIMAPRAGRGEMTVLRLYRVSPALKTLYDSLAQPPAAHESATTKKEAVSA